MTTRSITLVCLCAAFAQACSSDEGPTCGAGTQEVGGECVPAATACQQGTHLDAATGACVPDFAEVCGAGTELGADGACVPSQVISCGPGTILEDDTCVPFCTGDQVFDETTEACVDQCSPGTVFNSATGTCQPLCVDDEYYVVGVDACVHVPECLRNAMLGDASGDCEGWPWNELSLETVCARRAFHLCDSMFDCGCDHGGLSVIGRGSDPLDYASCLAEHTLACDVNVVSPAADLVGMGQLAVVPQGLADFDAHFAIADGVCTRPVGWEPWPEELFGGVFEGAVPRGGECADNVACSSDDYCTFDEEYQPTPLDPPTRFTCQPRAAANERCEEMPCAGDLLCLANEEGASVVYRCQGPRSIDMFCDHDTDCVEGLFCYPGNLPAFLSGSGPSLALPTCQAPIVAGARCPGEGWQAYQDQFNGGFRYNPNQAHYRDLCGPTRLCKNAVPSNGFVGACQAATGSGVACDWCGERAFGWRYEFVDTPDYVGQLWMSNDYVLDWFVPYTEALFGECGAGLTCAYDDSVASRGSCVAEVSVCLFTPDQIYDVDAGGICTEVCDDGIDNDNDGLDTDGDGSYEFEYIDCDDSDCALDANCFEYVCDDGLDDDGDSPGGTVNIDCEDFDCCYAVSDVCITADAGSPGNNLGTGACDEAANCANYGYDLLSGDYGPVDDDGDGLANCDDPDCADDPACNT